MMMMTIMMMMMVMGDSDDYFEHDFPKAFQKYMIDPDIKHVPKHGIFGVYSSSSLSLSS